MINSERLESLKNFGRIASPVVLGLLVLVIFTQIIYSGGQRESIAAKAEAELIDISLSQALLPAAGHETLVVSLKDSDLPLVEKASSSTVIDASIEEYAMVLDRILAGHPDFVLVSWLAAAHETDRAYLKPITDVIDKYGAREKVAMAVPYILTGPLDDELKKAYRFYDGDDCVYEVNRFCSYMPSWDWVIQGIVDEFGGELPPSHISTNLPHVNPNFLANLPLEDSIPTASFADIFYENTELLKGKKYFFVGNDVLQRLNFRNSKYVLQRTYTVENSRRRSLVVDGKPIHVFWAQLAQMFLDHRSVAVFSRIKTWAVAIGLALVIVYASTALSPSAALGVLLSFMFVFPFFNGFTIREFGFYVPQFDIIYAGLMVFIFTTFTMISYNNYQRLRVQALSEEFLATADIKSNFISLVSHNLNTPIAKIIGLIDIFRMSPFFSADRQAVTEANELIGRVHLIVRSVLISTTIKQRSLAHTMLTASKLYDLFDNDLGATIRRLGMTYQLDEDHGVMDVFYLDGKAVSHAIGCMIALFWRLRPVNATVSLELAGGRPHDDRVLIVRVTVPLATPEDRDAVPVTQDGLDSEFMFKVLDEFLTTATGVYGGSYTLSVREKAAEAQSFWRLPPQS